MYGDSSNAYTFGQARGSLPPVKFEIVLVVERSQSACRDFAEIAENVKGHLGTPRTIILRNSDMVWRTSSGIRSLEGIEAALYLEAVQSAVDYTELMDDELDVKTGDRIFDSANVHQKVVILHRCLSALLEPEVEAPELTSVLEAGAYFPFAYLQMRVEEEIAEEDEWSGEEEDLKYAYRRLLWKAFEGFVRPRWESAIEEYGAREEEADFSDRSTNLDLWEEIIDELADRIFWDRDWQVSSIAPQLLDGIEPEFSQITGLDEDYVTNRLPSVTKEEAAIALIEIRNWKISSQK
ncbi:hypothetical protein [Phormidesmis priestleyi]